MFSEQESVPVRCIPPTFVVSRKEHGTTDTLPTLPLEGTYDQRYPILLAAVRNIRPEISNPPCEQIDRHL